MKYSADIAQNYDHILFYHVQQGRKLFFICQMQKTKLHKTEEPNNKSKRGWINNECVTKIFSNAIKKSGVLKDPL